MLFRPPDIQLYDLDRIACLLLVIVVGLRALLLRQSLRPPQMVTWPLLGLIMLAISDALTQPYQAEVWSVLAAKWVVPFAMFYMAGLVFQSTDSCRGLELFLLIVLAYLSVTAILFLFGMKSLVLPPFVVDESVGIHADRARGPFLQAVANGVTLNLLAIVALDGFRRKRLHGGLALLFFIALPLAILATKTRAVWLSFAASAFIVPWVGVNRRIKAVCVGLMLAAAAALAFAFTFNDLDESLLERFEERSPVEFRLAVYRAGWDMFCSKPLLGWGAAQMQADLDKRISGFHQEEFFVHNTFLEIGVDYGLAGLALYAWLIADLIRLGVRSRAPAWLPGGTFLDRDFRLLWPILIAVYLLNACFVVMNYQFVNSVLFTLAGILAAQNRAAPVLLDSR